MLSSHCTLAFITRRICSSIVMMPSESSCGSKWKAIISHQCKNRMKSSLVHYQSNYLKLSLIRIHTILWFEYPLASIGSWTEYVVPDDGATWGHLRNLEDWVELTSYLRPHFLSPPSFLVGREVSISTPPHGCAVLLLYQISQVSNNHIDWISWDCEPKYLSFLKFVFQDLVTVIKGN